MKVTTMNISLPAKLARFVRARVESGHYSSVSEVVREALRSLAGQQRLSREGPLGAPTTTLFLELPTTGKKAIEAMEGLRELARGTKFGGLSLEDLAHEGHEVR